MSGLTRFDLLAVLALAGIAALVALPQRRVRRMMSNEDRVVTTLRALDRRLGEHQRAARRDVDRDGIGEYAPLTDVLGDLAPSARRVGESHVWELGGYRYEVLTPGARKVPVPAGSDLEVTNFAEVSYAIAAWPSEPGETGMRAYLQTPQGVLRHQIDGYPYGDDAPAPEWVMVRFEEAGKVVRAPPYAENDWKPPVQDLRR